MSYMFNGCSKLTTIYVYDDWDMNKVTNTTDMFAGCSVLVGGNNTKCDGVSNIGNDYAKIDNTEQVGYFTDESISYTVTKTGDGVTKVKIYRGKEVAGVTQTADDNGEHFVEEQVVDVFVELEDGELIRNIKLYDEEGELIDSTDVVVTKKEEDLYEFTMPFQNITLEVEFGTIHDIYWYLIGEETTKTLHLAGMIPTASEYKPGQYFGDEEFTKNLVFSRTDAPWDSEKTNIVEVVFDNEVEPLWTSCWFYGMENLTTITSMTEYLDTSSVKAMARMFESCSGLTELDLSTLDTSNVTNMESMFNGCSGLTSINVSSFNTENVTGMKNMFSGCSSLTELDLSSFDTTKVKSMSYMYNGSSKLERIYIGEKYSISSLKDNRYYAFAFTNCEALVGGNNTKFNSLSSTGLVGKPVVDIVGQKGFLTDKNNSYKVAKTDVANGIKLYRDDQINPSLVEVNEVGDGTMFVKGQIVYAEMPTSGGELVKSVKAYNSDKSEIIELEYEDSITDKKIYSFTMPAYDVLIDIEYEEGVVYYYKENVDDDVVLHFTNIKADDVEKYTWGSEWAASNSDVTKVEFDTVVIPKTTENLFNGFTNLQSVYFVDGDGNMMFDTRDTTNMSYMFNDCVELTTIYVSEDWDISSVSDATDMFAGCSKLVGGNNTKCDGASDIGIEYAKIDNTEQIGYFTNKNIAYIVIKTENCATRSKVYRGIEVAGVTQTADDDGEHFVEGQVVDVLIEVEAGKEICDVKLYDEKNILIASIKNGVEEKADNIYEFTMPAQNVVLDVEITESYDIYWYLTGDGSNKVLHLAGKRPTASEYIAGQYFGDKEFTKNLLFNRTDAPWDNEKKNIVEVVFDDEIKPLWTSYWFYGMENLTTIADMTEYLNTDGTTGMRYMFTDCKNLTEIDVSEFNTENVTTFAHMFEGCESIEELDLSTFNATSSESSLIYGAMNYMFNGCKNLTTIYATEKFLNERLAITDFVSAFTGCDKLVAGNNTKFYEYSLTALAKPTIDNTEHAGFFTDKSITYNVSKSDIAKDVKLYRDNQLGANEREISDGTKFVEEQVVYAEVPIPTGTDKIIKTVKAYSMDGSNEIELDYEASATSFVFEKEIYSFTMPAYDVIIDVEYEEGVIYYYKTVTQEGKILHFTNIRNENVKKYTFGTEWDESNNDVVNVVFDTVLMPKTTAHMFDGFENLTYIAFNSFGGEIYLDTSNVTDMSYMFASCSNLEELDLSTFELQDGVLHENMFINSDNISLINISSSFANIINDGTQLKYHWRDEENNYYEYDNVNNKTTIPAVAGEYVRCNIVKFDATPAASSSEWYDYYIQYIAEPETPKVDGYEFVAWYKDEARENLWDFDTDVIEGDITLYAKYVLVYTIKFDKNGGTRVMADMKKYKGDEVFIDASKFQRIGWTFTGVEMKETGKIYAKNTTFVLDETFPTTFTLIAQWNKNSVPGPYIPSRGGSNGGGGGSDSGATIPIGNSGYTPVNRILVRKEHDFDTAIGFCIWELNANQKWNLKINYAGQEAYAGNGYVDIKIPESNVIKDKVYYFDGNGDMVIGWAEDTKGNVYYFDEAAENLGKMVYGWREVRNGNWYFFGIDGIMYKNAMTPDGKVVGADGKYIPGATTVQEQQIQQSQLIQTTDSLEEQARAIYLQALDMQKKLLELKAVPNPDANNIAQQQILQQQIQALEEQQKNVQQQMLIAKQKSIGQQALMQPDVLQRLLQQQQVIAMQKGWTGK